MCDCKHRGTSLCVYSFGNNGSTGLVCMERCCFSISLGLSLYCIPILVPRATIILTCGRDRELWPDPIFWACAEYLFHILSQSDLPDLTGSLWIANFRCWRKPELSIPAAGQNDRGLWGRECCIPWTNVTNLLRFTSLQHLSLFLCEIIFWSLCFITCTSLPKESTSFL